MKRNIESVVEELKSIPDRYIMFIDDELMIDTARAMKLARRIKEEGIEKELFCFVRADTISANPELIKAWADIGLSEAFVGLESSSDEQLADRGKTTRVNVNDAALATLEKFGVNCVGSLIIRPDYGKKEFKQLFEYCKRVKLVSPQFDIMTPVPGTDLYETVKDQIIDEARRNFDLWDFSHTVLPTKMDLGEFYSEYSNLFNYHREEAPVNYHMKKLQRLSPQQAENSLKNIFELQECISTLTSDHNTACKSTA